MANLIIKIEKDDINISDLGDDIIIKCENDIILNFTKESIQELISKFDVYSKNDVSNLIKKLVKNADFISFTEEYGPKGWIELDKWINDNI